MRSAYIGSKFKVGWWKFLPNFWSSLATLLLFPLFVYLGFWQLERMEIKQNWEHARKLAIQAKPITIEELQEPTLSTGDTEWFRYRQLQAEGRFLPNKNILLDNQVLNGQAGYRVLSPFRFSGIPLLILVDRGFIPWGQDRGTLAPLETPAETIKMIGILTQVSSGLILKKDPISANISWPLLIQKIDYQELSEKLGHKLCPYLLQLPKDAPHSFQYLPLGFGLSAKRHLGYAIQWFTMAAAILIYYWVTHMKSR